MSMGSLFAKATFGAKNWIVIGGFSFQPTEFGKLSLVAYLAASLQYYGKNLDALQDCLGDIDTPTRLYVMRDASADPASEYAQEMDKLCLVLLRAARENEMLSVSINTVRWPD